jgi:hypothetical protein
LLFHQTSATDPFLAGVAIYVVQASVSGGWSFLPLLLLGSFLQLGMDQRDLLLTRMAVPLDRTAVRFG